MTDRKEKLQELLDAVKAGMDGPRHHRDAFPNESVGHRRAWYVSQEVSSGSLDAALALHKVLMPGWAVANLGQDMADGSGEWAAWITSPNYLEDCTSSFEKNPIAARAWLCAILQAMINEATT